MKVLDHIEKLERWMGRLLGNAGAQALGTPHELEPVEIRRLILDDFRSQVTPGGRGEYVFPFSEAQIEVFAADADRVPALQAILDPQRLVDDVDSALTERGCRGARPAISLEVAESAERAATPRPFSIRYARTPSRPAAVVERPPASLAVLSGTSSNTTVSVTRNRTFMGRLKEVRDREGRLLRENDLAFDESEKTVSRRHARIVFDPSDGKFRLFDDGSSEFGTKIYRDGLLIACDNVQGSQLRGGDEIQLGQARVRFQIE